MDWKKEIIEGMKLISSGCARNMYSELCDECPFVSFCKSINTDHCTIPEDWAIEEE